MTPRIHALVLAGDRRSPDPVALAAGSPCKALAPVGGRPMVLRVLDALAASGKIHSTVLCGPSQPALMTCPELCRRMNDRRIQWVEPAVSPTRSVESGLALVESDAAVLITTADHALLSAEMAGFFVDRSLQSGADATVGLVRYSMLKQAIPGTRRTVQRFSDDHYCTCNLFCLMTPASRSLVTLWRNVEQERKKPWRVIAGVLGPIGVLSYGLGLLSMPEALARLSHRLKLRIEAVEMPFPLAAIDVDTAEDLELVRELVERDQLR